MKGPHQAPGAPVPLLLFLCAVLVEGCGPAPHQWTPVEAATIASLSLSHLPPLPPDPSNAVGDRPEAAALGHQLFFDARFSRDGKVSCAHCHKPELYFTDGLPRRAGSDQGRRHTPTVVGTAYNAWFFWDGRRDSQWSQALVPLEHPEEHGGTRLQYAHLVARHYGPAYQAVFGPLPDLSDATRFPASASPEAGEQDRIAWAAMQAADREAVNRVFADLGKAIAAYERTLLEGRARFDDYADAVERGDTATMTATLSEAEARGLRLFIGRAHCIDCHHGPRFTNGDFHDTHLPSPPDSPTDMGRADGIILARENLFRCDGPFSDAGPDDCQELHSARTQGPELIAAMKVPSLRNVARTAPYMHRGQLVDLAAVLEHYNFPRGPKFAPSALTPLNLSAGERADLEAFLHTLDGPIRAPDGFLGPPR